MTSTPEPTATTLSTEVVDDATAPSTPPTGRAVPFRLILMMFLQFFVPGTFTATLGLILITYDLRPSSARPTP